MCVKANARRRSTPSDGFWYLKTGIREEESKSDRNEFKVRAFKRAIQSVERLKRPIQTVEQVQRVRASLDQLDARIKDVILVRFTALVLGSHDEYKKSSTQGQHPTPIFVQRASNWKQTRPSPVTRQRKLNASSRSCEKSLGLGTNLCIAHLTHTNTLYN